MRRGDFIVGSNTSLRAKVKAYRQRAKEVELYLTRHPKEWGRFQSELNQELNGIFRDIMLFARENLAAGREERVYKLKRIFINRWRRFFLRGEYAAWSFNKPFGYPGDFKIMDGIYRNAPETTGFDRLFDNYFQMSAICTAVRNRKEDFKTFILEAMQTLRTTPFRVMNLACGPCREVKEILERNQDSADTVTFDCYDHDPMAISYASGVIGTDPRVKFFQENAVRLALKKDIGSLVRTNYDFIYSTGLFDYLDRRISVRLVRNLRSLLKEGGVLAISDVREKFSNPSVYCMEWVADWNLLYRDDEDFRAIFLEAGFSSADLDFRYEQQGVMQYVLAKKVC